MLHPNCLLNLADKAMQRNVRQLRFLKERWAGTGRGIERWFQIELMTEIATSSKLDVRLRKEGPDLEVDGVLVELKCPTDYSVNWIKDGFKHKPEPDVVMFLSISSEEFLEKLGELEKKGYRVVFRNLISTPDWVLGYLMRRHRC